MTFYVSVFVKLAKQYILNRFVAVPYEKPIEKSLCDKLNTYSNVCTHLTFDLFLELYVLNLPNCLILLGNINDFMAFFHKAVIKNTCFNNHILIASSEFGTYRICEQRRFRRACASAQSRQNLRCSLIQAVSQEEPSDRKPDPWPL